MKEKLYEMTSIYDPDLSEEGLDEEISKFKDLLKKFNGRFAKNDIWGKRKFVYPIKKKSEGWYVTYYFLGEPDLPASLNEQLKLNEKLLRFLIVRSNEKIQLPETSEATAETPSQ